MADHAEPSPDATLSKSQASPPRRKSSDWEAQKQFKVEINVGNPIMKEELFTKHFVYKIQGTDFKGYFELTRRYSDFEKIRQLLVIRWPGCFIPSLPAKKINNMGKDVVDDRRKHLDNFCKRVAEIPHLHYSDVYQVFLRTKMTDLDPLLAKYQKVSHEDIIARYTKAFAHLSGKDINSDAQFKITNFSAFVQKSVAQFEKYKKVAKKYVTARKDFTATFVEMHGMMSNEYEKNVFSEYHEQNPNKNVFLDPTTNKMNENVERVRQYQSQEVVDKLYEWIKSEGRDIEAFAEAFAQRDKYTDAKNKVENKNKSDTKDLQNMASGKTTFKSLFTSGKKEQNLAKLEDKVSGTSKDLENLGLIHEMITVLLAYEEIDKFRSQRIERYYKLIEETSKFEMETFSTILSYWREMLENPNVKSVEH